MTVPLLYGDQVSCSRVGGVMRRESSRLRQRAQLLEDASHAPDREFGAFAAWQGPDADAVRDVIATAVRALRATAQDLDDAGAALQSYATDLAQAHELGRRALLRVRGAGLLIDGTRVIEPWGPASAKDAGERRSHVPEVQARVDLATAHVGRARGRLRREMTRLGQSLSESSRAVDPDLRAPLRSR